MNKYQDMHKNTDLFHTLFIYYFWRTLKWVP